MSSSAGIVHNGAIYLGQQDRIGSLAPGKQADLVLIKGDPSKHIDEIENVKTVFGAAQPANQLLALATEHGPQTTSIQPIFPFVKFIPRAALYELPTKRN